MKPIPCKDCITLPICRHKHYPNLVNECTLISTFLVTPYEFTLGRDAALKRLGPIIRSTKWHILEPDDKSLLRSVGTIFTKHYKERNEELC